MKRLTIIAVTGAFVLLSGCATSPAKLVFTAKSGLVAAEATATEYAKLPRCAPGVTANGLCSDQKRVDTNLSLADAGRTTINAAEKVVRDPAAPKSAIQQAAEASQKAVAALLSYLGAKS